MRTDQFPAGGKKKKKQSKQTNKNPSWESFLQTRVDLLGKPRESPKGLKPTLSWFRVQTGLRFPPFCSTSSWAWWGKSSFSLHPFASECSWADAGDRSPTPLLSRTSRNFKQGLPHQKGSHIELIWEVPASQSQQRSQVSCLPLLPTRMGQSHWLSTRRGF